MPDGTRVAAAATVRPDRVDDGRPSRGARRARRAQPTGMPWWVRLFGVAVIPLHEADATGPRALVLSVGTGAMSVAGPIVQGPTAP